MLRRSKLPDAFAKHSDSNKVVAAAVELLNAAGISVRYEDTAVAVYCNGSRTIQLSVAAALCPKLEQEVAHAVEFQDAVVPIIHDIDIAAAVQP